MKAKRILYRLFLSALSAIFGCGKTSPMESVSKNSETSMHKKTIVRRTPEPIVMDADWNKPVWRSMDPITVALYMGQEPSHRPLTQAKLAWDDDFVYVIFHVEDYYVRAVATEHQQMVCQDSCVEFFFTPGSEIKTGYFNLEVNSIGTMLMYHQMARGQDKCVLDDDDLAAIQIATSLPQGQRIDPEIQKPTVWTVEYALPWRMLQRYAPVSPPTTGEVWRANFYKCADRTSQPHWLTWSKVPLPNPDFHQPSYFGFLEFAGD